MKNRIVFAAMAFVIACSWPCAAQNDASDWLQRLRGSVASKGDYAVPFAFETSDGASGSGYYRVRGERYYLSLGAAQVYCDGKVRYEVNAQNREVTIVGVDGNARNLLDNPTHAFDFLDDAYASELVSASAERVVIRLVPRRKGAVTEILLTVDAGTALPVSVEYRADDLRVAVTIRSFDRTTEAFPEFDKKRYRDYEWIDFR